MLASSLTLDHSTLSHYYFDGGFLLNLLVFISFHCCNEIGRGWGALKEEELILAPVQSFQLQCFGLTMRGEFCWRGHGGAKLLTKKRERGDTGRERREGGGSVFLFSSVFVSKGPPAYWKVLSTCGVCLSQVLPPYTSHLWKCPYRHTQTGLY